MKIAILYQVKEAPAVGNIRKPMKKGGYSDSGSDIAVELKNNGIRVITPVDEPNEMNDLDWVFGDDDEGISAAIAKGADILWLNTVLYDGHPIEKYIKNKTVKVIGQNPYDAGLYDNKLYTNQMLLRHGLSAIDAVNVKSAEDYNGPYPCVIKPIRGRGSQGVSVVKNIEELRVRIKDLIEKEIYGTEFMLEPFLTGEEITVAVFPADAEHNAPYCLPPVVRFNHADGIAPYSGKIAVTKNSRAVDDVSEYAEIMDNCKAAYSILGLRAPIRIDCRKNGDGKFVMFDINMKPNMTLASRPHRADQDSLVMMAAKSAGMSRIELLNAYINTAWN